MQSDLYLQALPAARRAFYGTAPSKGRGLTAAFCIFSTTKKQDWPPLAHGPAWSLTLTWLRCRLQRCRRVGTRSLKTTMRLKESFLLLMRTNPTQLNSSCQLFVSFAKSFVPGTLSRIVSASLPAAANARSSLVAPHRSHLPVFSALIPMSATQSALHARTLRR